MSETLDQVGGNDVRAGVRRWWIKSLAGIAFTAAMIFLAAGDLGWTWGWVYLGIYVLVTVVTGLVVDPGLLAERAERRKGKSWDTPLVSVIGLLAAFVVPLLAAFDQRYSWSAQLSVGLQVAAVVVCLSGWGLHIWAMAVNKFHAVQVRIQDDRGQRVITGGPYRYVRHPGYVGAVLLNVSAPIVLGSTWSLIPGGLAALLMILRTVLEDSMLQRELEGYAEYARQVRYRLLPGIW